MDTKRPMKSKGQANAIADAFTQGYVCAVAALVAGHGADTMARDVLGCNTPKDWSIIDDHDRDILAKAGLAPRRRKTRKASSDGRGNDAVEHSGVSSKDS